MADTNLIIQALQQAQQGPYQRNPWIAAGAMPSVATSEYGKAAESILKGLMGGYGYSQANEQSANAMTNARSLMAGGDVNALLSNPDTAQLGQVMMMGQMEDDRALKLAEKRVKIEKDAQVEAALRTNGIVIDPNNSNRVQMMDNYGNVLREIENAKSGRMPPNPELLAQFAQQQAGEPDGPKLGVPTLDQIEQETYQRLRQQMPEQQAAVSAREKVQRLSTQAKQLFGKPLADSQQSLATLDRLITDLRQGIDQAGVTGAPVASSYEKIASLMPWATEAKKQVAGDALLDTVGMQAVGQAKSALPGPLSNWESQKLFAVGPGSDKPKAVNEQFLKRYEQLKEVTQEYNDFMNYFADATGGNPQKAKQYWELYKRANPIVVETGNGAEINTNRTPWQQFDFKNAYSNFLSGGQVEAPPIQQQQGGGITPDDRARIEQLKAQLRGGQ